MATRIKFCGITNKQDLEQAIECGVDFIGFVLAAHSPRVLTPQQAAQLAHLVPKNIQTVAVYKTVSAAELTACFDTFQPNYLQADAAAFQKIKLPKNITPLPVYRNQQPTTSTISAPLILFESNQSGQGQLCNLALATRISQQQSLLLAGGLTPKNITPILQQVAPTGVDVSSGIESTPGQKCLSKMQAFVSQVKLYDAN